MTTHHFIYSKNYFIVIIYVSLSFWCKCYIW